MEAWLSKIYLSFTLCSLSSKQSAIFKMPSLFWLACERYQYVRWCWLLCTDVIQTWYFHRKACERWEELLWNWKSTTSNLNPHTNALFHFMLHSQHLGRLSYALNVVSSQTLKVVPAITHSNGTLTKAYCKHKHAVCKPTLHVTTLQLL